MNRRTFIASAATAVAAGCASLHQTEQAMSPYVMTVSGPVSVDDLGVVLPHEHVMVDFVGAAQAGPHRYDADTVFEKVAPILQATREQGVSCLMECTPAYLGRDAVLMKRLSDSTGLHLVTNTGYYGAAGDKFVPTHAYSETAEQLAARWIAEWEHGIDGTGIRPGFIKTAVDNGPLSEIDRKLVEAACLCHKATGLTIASHTTNSEALSAELTVLDEYGVSPDAFVWVHAFTVPDTAFLAEAAGRGVWLEFDGLHPDRLDLHVDLVVAMRDAGLLERVLISHDAGWYAVGEPDGGTFRSFELMMEQFVPALRERGFGEAEIKQLVVRNPATAFAVRY